MTKILIVDDKESNLYTLENVLKRLDVRIVKAATGNEALRATLNHDFALAIVDVQMPVMDGYELANLLRSDERTRSIPIIFLSAVYSEEHYVFRGYEAGAVDFITKPFVPEVLLSKVRVFLELNERKAELVSHKYRLEGLVAKLEEQAEARGLIELEILRKNTLLEGMNKVLREAITCETEEELAKTCLRVAEELTGSKFGFIGEIGEDHLFIGIAMSDPGWSECRMPKSDAVRLLHNMEIRGIWGEVLKVGGPLIVNDPASDPGSTGYPQGHPTIRTLIGIPLKKGDVITGMIALANKEGGYEQADIKALEPLCAAFVEALSRKRAEDLVRRAHDELEFRVRERTAELRTSIARLELLNRELQEFAHVASHDLQEPLRKIQTFCDMAQKRCAPTLDSTGQEYLDKVLNSATRMRQLLDDLLQFSRVAARPEPFQAVDLQQIVREAADVFEETVRETGALVEIEKMPAIEADETQILRLFQNLIGNALKFRGAEKPRIIVYARQNGRGICEIFVKDNGIGFEQQYAERIFKPFQRLHTRNEYEGTGIGLAICRKIAERHGGSIRAESEPGKGSTFIVSLPEKQDRLEGI